MFATRNQSDGIISSEQKMGCLLDVTVPIIFVVCQRLNKR